MLTVRPFTASTFRSDGGTMFGLVPKPIWSKLAPPDESNRIAQHARCLLIKTSSGELGLIDLGCGPRCAHQERDADLHGLGPGWPLSDYLHHQGISREAISFVAFTHLHWDHAGGLLDEARGLTFPNARYCIHQQEWSDAFSGNPLLGKSYPGEVLQALQKIPPERLELVTADRQEIRPGLFLTRSSGHTAGHCVVHGAGSLLHHQNRSIEVPGFVFAGDVCPSRHHLRTVFQTSYDTFPLDTRSWKLHWLPRIAKQNEVLLFDHDPETAGSTLRLDGKGGVAPDNLFSA